MENSLITVIDTETASLSGGVVEVAWVCVDASTRSIEDWRTGVTNPGGWPVEVEARAVHHITDEEIAAAPPLEDWLRANVDDVFGSPPEIAAWCAHNAPFDSAVLPARFRARNLLVGDDYEKGDAVWIDTLRCARHLWPDSPRFSNQVIRYHLGLDCGDMPPKAGATPHRALFDAWVTAKLLLRMLQDQTIEELIVLSGEPARLQGPIKFGKYAGTDWSRLDRGYLRWLADNASDPDVRHTVWELTL